MIFQNDVVVVGGCGHVGLPLAISLASKKLKVVAFDINKEAVNIVNSGVMPFIEAGSQEILIQVINDSNFCASSDKSLVSTAEHVVVVIGTPVDEHLNPDPITVPRAVKGALFTRG
jgi:UDP-N-acetyl-D-mannosaminuronic acid dehydrogenase